jgi:hypothetical protein
VTAAAAVLGVIAGIVLLRIRFDGDGDKFARSLKIPHLYETETP